MEIKEIKPQEPRPNLSDNSAEQGEKPKKGSYTEVFLHFKDDGSPREDFFDVLKETLESREARVLFIVDQIKDPRIRNLLSAEAAKLKGLGFTHFGIEAPEEIQPSLDELSEGKDINLEDLQIGPGLRLGISYGSYLDKIYVDAVRAMAEKGMKVVALDDGRIYRGGPISAEERERKLCQNLLSILEQQEGAKVCVLAEAHHAFPGKLRGGVPTLASMLREAGVSVVTVNSLVLPPQIRYDLIHR